MARRRLGQTHARGNLDMVVFPWIQRWRDACISSGRADLSDIRFYCQRWGGGEIDARAICREDVFDEARSQDAVCSQPLRNCSE